MPFDVLFDHSSAHMKCYYVNCHLMYCEFFLLLHFPDSPIVEGLGPAARGANHAEKYTQPLVTFSCSTPPLECISGGCQVQSIGQLELSRFGQIWNLE